MTTTATDSKWVTLIQSKEAQILEAITDAERQAINEIFNPAPRLRCCYCVLLWGDGTIETGYCPCEDNNTSDTLDGEAIEIARQIGHLASDYNHPEAVEVDVIMEDFDPERILQDKIKELSR